MVLQQKVFVCSSDWSESDIVEEEVEVLRNDLEDDIEVNISDLMNEADVAKSCFEEGVSKDFFECELCEADTEVCDGSTEESVCLFADDNAG